ncbi:hypothetical protein [Janthinobacterium sp. PSPC1-1]|uniref:hypothetical protein n=1 Tax=Janthinobacterium sp. PSPC1-1 TaxID=2804581 RepID=UPI003CEF166E
MENDQNEIESFKIETTIIGRTAANRMQITLPVREHRLANELPVKKIQKWSHAK